MHKNSAAQTVQQGEVLDKFSGTEFTCQYKYDGERVQVSKRIEKYSTLCDVLYNGCTA